VALKVSSEYVSQSEISIEPADALTKTAKASVGGVLCTAYALPDIPLYAEAKASLAVFNPKFVDSE
jgi:hypothetical protein